MAGWLAVTRRYCVKTAKPILKRFRPSGLTTCADTQFQGNPFSGEYTGVGKIGDFRRKSPFISETVRDRPMVTSER